MSLRSTPATRSVISGPVVGSIIIIIIVMVTVNTTLDYSANQATTTNGPSASSTTALTAATTTAAAITINSWSPSSSYPTTVWVQSCVPSGGDVVCVGGLTGTNTAQDVTDDVYYAPLPPSGAGQWVSTTSYPVGIREESCVASGGEIYCVGGYTNSTISSGVYYAKVTSSGVGRWSQTTSYPFPLWGQSCVTSTGEVYCIGGITGPLSNTTAVYSAHLTSSGVGPWTQAPSYPSGVYQQSCVTANEAIYCMGGRGSPDVYYASLSPSSGLGQWSSTTAYPATGLDYPSCVASTTGIFCVGGYTGPVISDSVYYAPFSSPSGIGTWSLVSSYPIGVWGESCVASGGSVYCIGGSSTGSAVVSGVYHS